MTVATNTATLTLAGASGAKYNFEVFRLDTSFNPVAAVYAVTRRDSNGQHTVVYIGQTRNLPERFDDHHKEMCFRRHSANCICVHGEGSERRRLAIEADLIANYAPPCNG
jgi:hypothetical protein